LWTQTFYMSYNLRFEKKNILLTSPQYLPNPNEIIRRQLKNEWMQSNMNLMIIQVVRLISNLDIYRGTFLKSTKYEDVDD